MQIDQKQKTTQEKLKINPNQSPVPMPLGLEKRSHPMRYAWQLWTFGEAPDFKPVRSTSTLAKKTGLTRHGIEQALTEDGWEQHALVQLATERDHVLRQLPTFIQTRDKLISKLKDKVDALEEFEGNDEGVERKLAIVERLARLTGYDKRLEVESKVEQTRRGLILKAQAKLAEAEIANSDGNNTRKVEGMTFDIEAG